MGGCIGKFLYLIMTSSHNVTVRVEHSRTDRDLFFLICLDCLSKGLFHEI